MQHHANLYVIAAPSGAGKTSLVHALIETIDGLCVSVSHTTRRQRPGEENGVHYYFVDKKDFEAMIQANDFLEYAKVFQQDYYGTSHTFVMEKIHQNIDVILEIDWQGAAQIKQRFPQAITIFILPPSQQALQERLTQRARDDADTIKTRMSKAKDEMSHYTDFDYLVINDQFSQALADLQAIIRAQRLRQVYQVKKYLPLIQALLTQIMD